MKKRIIAILIVVCLLIAFGATVTIEWLYDTFGHLSMDEIIFHLKVPMEGTNTDIIFIFIKECLWKVILPTLIISFASLSYLPFSMMSQIFSTSSIDRSP